MNIKIRKGLIQWGPQGRYRGLVALVSAMVRHNIYETGKILLDLNNLDQHVTLGEEV